MKILISLLSLFMIISCNHKQTSENAEITIELSIDKCLSMDSSNYSVNYEILPLSAGTTDAMISGIEKIVAFEDYLYIFSRGMRGNAGVFIFKRDGSFVKKLTKGKGRGEFLAPSDIIIDKKNKQLEVLDRMGFFVLRYTLDGTFQSKSTLPRANYFEFCKLDSEEYLLFNSLHSFRQDTAYYFQRSKDGLFVEEYITKTKGLKNLLSGLHFFENNDIYCNGTYGNIVYKYDKDRSSLSPYIKMNPILEKDSKELINKSSYFKNFRLFDKENLLSFTFKGGLMYDIKRQETYRHLLPIYFKYIGADNNGEYFYIFPEKVEKLKEYTPTSNKGKEIVDKIISMTNKDTTESNPYIIYLSYEKK